MKCAAVLLAAHKLVTSTPGLDGKGPCKAGKQSCILSAGNTSSDWGPCEGAVGPANADSCNVTGDDSNCDGTPNGGCTCVEGTTIPCGPETDNGICQHGTSTCRNGGFGACEGAVFAGRRDCSSPQDNDCDGLPDNTIIDLQSATTHACFLTGAGGAFQGGAEAVSLSKSTGTWRGWAVILVKRHWSGAARCMLMPSTSDAFVTQFNTPSPLALDSSRTGACYRTFLCGDFGAEGDFVQTEWNGSGWEFDRQVGGTRSLRGAAVCFGRNDETGVPAL